MAKGRKTGGRVSGSTNKLPTLREMGMQALANKGGIGWLEKLADEYPVAFAGFLGKIMPLQIKEGGGEIRMPKPVVVELHQGPPPKRDA